MPAKDLQTAITHMVKLKNEHRALLSQIAGDRGMSPEVRQSLVDHLYEEEDEHMVEIAALSGGAKAPQAPSIGGGLSVGSMQSHPSSSTTLGSLRREHAGSPSASNSVGSLRGN